RVRIIDGLDGYRDDEAASREFFRGGYFYSGDLGVFRHDGKLGLRGRASDVINIQSAKIAVEPMERALKDKLQEEAVCIVGVENQDLERILYVVIESSGRVEMAGIEAAVRTEVETICRMPASIVLAKRLPRTASGKIQRFVLREQLKARGIV